MDYLFLMLGTGYENRTEVLAREYREATYFLPDDEGAGAVTTPFVGEAIHRLHDGRFQEVHLFGTADSMWHTLFRHLRGPAFDGDDEHFFFEVADEVDGRDVGPETLARLEQAYSAALDVPVCCHVLPLPTTSEAMWATLAAMTETDLVRGRLSIDVTHGLRAHPVFSLLALFFLRAVHPGLDIGAVFYGALELQDDFDGRAPILDLRPVVELMDWLEAARAFTRHGDAALIARQLRAAGGGEADALAKRAEYVSRVLQLNTLADLPANANNFLSALAGYDGEGLPALDLLRPLLASFPEEVAQVAEDAPEADLPWQVYLKTARYHWNHYRAGLAVLAAYEAVVSRLAAIYGKGPALRQEEHTRLADIATSRGIRYSDYPDHLRTFNDQCRRLRTWRNGIAHADQKGRSFQPNEIFRGQYVAPDGGAAPLPAPWLEYLEATLPDDWLDTLPSLYAWP